MIHPYDAHERRMWAGQAPAYERSFAKMCAQLAPHLITAVGLSRGQRLLDAGTGPGTVARYAHDQGLVVTAVDAEPSMVALAQANVPGADIRQAILPDLPFDDATFDAAVANFVLNHVGDPTAAVRALARVVRPAGRVGVTVWPATPDAGTPSLWVQAIEAAGAQRPADLPRPAAELDFERTPVGLVELLERGGLVDAGCELISFTHRTDPEEWWGGVAHGVGLAGQIIARQTPEMVALIRRHYDELSAAMLDDQGRLALPGTALLAIGTVPSR